MPLKEYSDAELEAEVQRRAVKAPKWGIYIPAQWVKGIEDSSRAVVEGVASRQLRGAFTYEAREKKPECFCGAPSCDICHGG